MREIRKVAEKLTFSGAGTETITVADNQHIQIFQVNISVDADTTFDIKIGTAEIDGGRIRETSLPIQLFYYAFGKGTGTGAKGDNLNVTLGAAGVAYVTYIIYQDS